MSTAEPFRIRRALLPEDKPALLGFIMGMQHFEKAIESDGRVDDGVAEEFYADIVDRVVRKNGRVLIAECAEGTAIGWAAAIEGESEVYVEADERTFGYIAELFVIEDMRGQGVGRALIKACEDWSKERGHKVLTIGVLVRNTRAHMVYRSTGFDDYVTMLRKYLR